MSLKIQVEEKRLQELRALTKTFFGLEKPLMQKYPIMVHDLKDLIRQLHLVFSSDSVNIE